MLPFITRNRRPGSVEPSSDVTVTEIMSSMKSTTRRFHLISLKAKCFFVVFVLSAVYIYGSIYWAWKDNRLTKEDFLGVDKCPSCYGRSMCFQLFDNQVELLGKSKLRALDLFNLRNVHLAYHKDRELNVVLKRLAHDDEIQKIDNEICEDSDRRPGCDLSRSSVVTKTSQDIVKNGLQPKHFKDSSFMFICPSHKLLNRVIDKYQEKTTEERSLMHDDKLQLLFTAKVNSEPILLQTFPKSEGWPFPEYYGACGRYVAVEHGGKELGEFYNAPFYRRADLAYQMVKMAKKLTEDPDFSLYWTDLAYENFAVDSAGKLMIIDAEHIIVVDKKATKIANPEHWDDLHQALFDDCEAGKHTKNCLTFDTDALCTHYYADHNYYALCRNMLSQYADDLEGNRPDGLLHDMPDIAKEDWDLENLLNECTIPSQPKGRIKVIPHLLEALDYLRFAQLKEDVENGNRRI